MLVRSLTLLFILGSLSQTALRAQEHDELAKYRQQALEKWEKDIQALEQLDKTQTDPENAILFLGSSSIRRWESIAEDMAPWAVIRRGYGGARFSDLAVFAKRLADPHQFDAVAIFVGNDISGGEQDKQPEEVLRLIKITVAEIRQQHPTQPIFLIAITPTSSRFDVWDQIRQVNQLMADYCSQHETLHYIDTAKHFLDSQGHPNDSLFVDDHLHLNSAGYQLWARLIKRELSKVLSR